MLRPGQYGRVQATTQVVADALLVPQRAVTELQGTSQVRIVDQLGRERYNNIFESPSIAAEETLSLPADSKGGVYILMIDQGKTQVRRKVMVQE